VDPSPQRRACADELMGGRADVRAPSASASDGRADIVIEATGNPALIDAAIAWAAPSSRIVVASFYGRRRAAIDLGDAFHRRRLTLIASQVSTIPPRLGARWTAARRFDLVCDLLGDRALDGVLAPPVPFEDAPRIYAMLDTAEDPLPCHVFEYG
jgi:threonine dehydrogenase-like Zn-dependent dehydrogenase